jgi:hypothetical protein
MKSKLLLALLMSLLLVIVPVSVVLAATTQDVTVTATPSFIGISNSPSTYDFTTITANTTAESATDAFTVDNTSSIPINVSIAVTTNTWSGGTGWTHSDTATAGADTAGLNANQGGTWGTGDVIIKYDTPNNIVSSQAANTDFSWGIQLVAPTSFSDGVQKQIIVRLTATSA